MKDYILEYRYKKDDKIYKITLRETSRENALKRYEMYSGDVGKDIEYLKLYECIKEDY